MTEATIAIPPVASPNDEAPWMRPTLERMDIDDLDWMAYGHIGDQIVEIDPSRITIKWHDDLENPRHRFAIEGMEWVRSVKFDEPVQVSVAQDGTLHLEDGHHRWFAAGKLGRTLDAVIEIKGKPIERIIEMQERGIPLHPVSMRPSPPGTPSTG